MREAMANGRMIRSRPRVAAAVVSVLTACFLQGCGTPSSTSAPTPSPTPSPTPRPTPGPTPPTPPGFTCQTDLQIEPKNLVQMGNKGMAVDDQTLFDCVDSMPQKWPNTNETVKSIRIFKSYRPGQSKKDVEKTRSRLVAHVKANNMKVLVGSQITCDDRDDEEDWTYTKELLKELGSTHILGLAVGNELDQLWHHSDINRTCIARIWNGHLYNETVRRISEARELTGHKTMPVTSVFTGEVLWEEDVRGLQETRKYLRQVMGTEKGVEKVSNYAFTWNFYPIFDPTSTMDEDGKHCQKAVNQSRCFDQDSCLTMKNVVQARIIMNQLMGTSGSSHVRYWIGELGWSSPKPATYDPPNGLGNCSAYTGYSMLYDYYRNFLAWNLTASGPEHAFYFTFRDSSNFGNKEHFGLVEDCGSKQCKLTKKRVKEDSEPNSTVVTTYI